MYSADMSIVLDIPVLIFQSATLVAALRALKECILLLGVQCEALVGVILVGTILYINKTSCHHVI